MNLPPLNIPLPPLGFDIPILAHPPVVHFAIVLPIFILLLEIINLFMKRRALTVTTFIFFIILMVVYFAAFATGKTDGSEAYDMLTQAGQADLKEHKLIGTYLMLATAVLFFLKLFSMALRTWWMKLLYLLALIGFVAAVFYQGKEGGELVYKHGANNEMVLELSNQIDDLKDELEELKEESGASEADEESTSEEKATESEEATPPAEEKPAAESSEEQEQKSEKPAATEANTSEAAPSDTVEAVKNAASEAVEKVTESAGSAVESAKEAGAKAAETTKETVKKATEAGKDVIESAKKLMGSEATE